MTHGVDASSGPLGQGIPMAAGMAMAEKFLSQVNITKKTLILLIIIHMFYVVMAICKKGLLMKRHLLQVIYH